MPLKKFYTHAGEITYDKAWEQAIKETILKEKCVVSPAIRLKQKLAEFEAEFKPKQ